jgi:CMP-2-keto-3-deoxyoctulosonic acid synthetase
MKWSTFIFTEALDVDVDVVMTKKHPHQLRVALTSSIVKWSSSTTICSVDADVPMVEEHLYYLRVASNSSNMKWSLANMIHFIDVGLLMMKEQFDHR